MKDVCKTQTHDIQPKTEFLLIDGAMFVHANPPATETFSEYSESFTMKIEKRTGNILELILFLISTMMKVWIHIQEMWEEMEEDASLHQLDKIQKTKNASWETQKTKQTYLNF